MAAEKDTKPKDMTPIATDVAAQAPAPIESPPLDISQLTPEQRAQLRAALLADAPTTASDAAVTSDAVGIATTTAPHGTITQGIG